ncbi:hypothetical protein R6Q57_009221 [Mikania cordata]
MIVYVFSIVLFVMVKNKKEWMLKQKRVDPSMRLAAYEICIFQATGRVEKLKTLKQYEKHVIVDYIRKWKHPMTEDLKKATIVRPGLKWDTIGNITDSVVFVMRHIEMVRSNCHTSFNCGFSTSPEEQRKQIEALRKKYASRIILTKINKLRKNVLDYACV